MKTIILAAALITTSSHATQAQSQGENIIFPLSKTDKMVAQKTENGVFRRFYMPENETSSNWTEMMEVMVLAKKNMDVKKSAQGVANDFANVCQGGTPGPIGLSETKGYKEATVVLNCPFNRKTSRPETHLVKVVQGNEKLYIVRKIFSSTITPQISLKIGAVTRGIFACDMRIKERNCPELVVNQNPADVTSGSETAAYRLEVKKAIHENMRDFQTCYKDAVAKTPGLAGVIDMHWDVDSSGTANHVEVNDKTSTIADAEMRACMITTLTRTRFPTNRFDKAVDVMNYPFRFGRMPAGH